MDSAGRTTQGGNCCHLLWRLARRKPLQDNALGGRANGEVP